jgi:hypothetical protein
MRCLHHVDADGYGAAAIVRYELTDPFDTVLPEHFVEYDHTGTITVDEEKFFKDDPKQSGFGVRYGSKLYIVDLALDQTIFDFVKKCHLHGFIIIHIDHHISGYKFLNEVLSDEDREWYKENVNYFFNNEYSGCMLTWLYACMNDTERANPMTVPFDFTEDFSQVAFNPETNVRIHGIPLAVRMIDDNDVWRHALPESKFFAAAWGIQDDKSPLNMEFWSELLYEGPKKAYDMIDDGEKIFKFMENQSKSVMKNAFKVKIGDHTGMVVNCPFGNSRLFGDVFEQYDFVIKYSQSAPNTWRYTIYSNEGGVDCTELISKYFHGTGGGDACAGGFVLNVNIFSQQTPIKYIEIL